MGVEWLIAVTGGSNPGGHEVSGRGRESLTGENEPPTPRFAKAARSSRWRTISGSLALPLCILAGGISLPAPDLVPNVGAKVPSWTTVPRQSGR
jgi:hypothetical protein